jgi:ribose transport system ATP-binding protein
MSVREYLHGGDQPAEQLPADCAAENARIDIWCRSWGSRSAHDDPVATLSGGNQQKVVIGKWLMTDARIVLLNDPTRGIDVGTKQELYQLLRSLADAGTTILFYTTDYDELVGCCDRVAIMYDGRILRELAGTEINEHNIVASSLNLPVERNLQPGGAAE